MLIISPLIYPHITTVVCIVCRTNIAYLWAAYDTAGPCYCSATCSYRNTDYTGEILYSIGGVS